MTIEIEQLKSEIIVLREQLSELELPDDMESIDQINIDIKAKKKRALELDAQAFPEDGNGTCVLTRVTGEVLGTTGTAEKGLCVLDRVTGEVWN